MSTCAGAPAPHAACPHGDACDWHPTVELHAERVAQAAGISVEKARAALRDVVNASSEVGLAAVGGTVGGVRSAIRAAAAAGVKKTAELRRAEVAIAAYEPVPDRGVPPRRPERGQRQGRARTRLVRGDAGGKRLDSPRLEVDTTAPTKVPAATRRQTGRVQNKQASRSRRANRG